MKLKESLVCLIVLTIFNIYLIPAYAANFVDVREGYWANNAIDALSQQRIITGYEDNTFRPDNSVTRAEFATMIIKALGQDNSPIISRGNFTDLPSSFWAYDNVQRAYSLGLIKGFPGGAFKPYSFITRSEVLAILSSAARTASLSQQQAEQILSRFYDGNQVPNWAIIPVAKAVNANLAVNYPQPNFLMPQERATRAEVAVMLYNLRAETGISQTLQAQPVIPQQGQIPQQQVPYADQISQASASGATSQVVLRGNIATLQQDSVIPTKLVTTLSSEIAQVGDPVILSIPQNITTNQGNILIPAGSRINGAVATVIPAKLGNRNAKMTINFNSLTLPNGQAYPLRASIATETGSIEAGSLKGKIGKGVLTTIGGAGAGAALGTALGAITGKTGKGAIYGTAIGGGLGALGAALAEGGAIKVPSGEPIFIKLEQPLSVDLTTGTIISQ